MDTLEPMNLVGTRVVRGPSWQWEDQDGGEGTVGTLVTVGLQEIEGTVVVAWDTGLVGNYRAGKHGCYDLCVLDNAATGITQSKEECSNCGKCLYGFVWLCNTCPSPYALCSDCYQNEAHDINHIFARRTFGPGTCPQLVSARRNAKAIQAKGLFVGAVVGPGLCWDEDAHGKLLPKDTRLVGDVISIDNHKSKYGRSVAQVRWRNCGYTSSCRLGLNGQVDIVAKQAALGGTYYPEHLPRLGAWEYSPHVQPFNPGDQVVVSPDFEEVKRQQEQAVWGWDEDMQECIGKEGIVRRITNDSGIRVTFSCVQPEARWTLHPNSLTMKQTILRWHPDNALPPLGEIPDTCESSELIPDLAPPAQPGVAAADVVVEGALLPDDFSLEHYFDLIRAKNWTKVSVLLKMYPALVNQKCSSDLASLHYAVYVMDIMAVRMLLTFQADSNLADGDGDSPLHYAMQRSCDQMGEMVRALIEYDANPNSRNAEGNTALHVAVNNNDLDAVKILLQIPAINIQIQDNSGNTATHDAAHKNYLDILAALLEHPTCDPALNNLAGFNVLHMAAVKGHAEATKLLISKRFDLVNVPKSVDGFTSLCLAAKNGCIQVLHTLLEDGQAETNKVTLDKKSALVLATEAGFAEAVEALIQSDADVNLATLTGDTPLHVALRKALAKVRPQADVLAEVHHLVLESRNLMMSELLETAGVGYGDLAIACYLVFYGADINRGNKSGVTPNHLLKDDPSLRKLFNALHDAHIRHQQPLNSPPQLPRPPMTEATTSKPRGVLETQSCIFCNNLADIPFVPCGHMCVCAGCVPKLPLPKRCPKCSTPTHSSSIPGHIPGAQSSSYMAAAPSVRVAAGVPIRPIQMLPSARVAAGVPIRPPPVPSPGVAAGASFRPRQTAPSARGVAGIPIRQPAVQLPPEGATAAPVGGSAGATSSDASEQDLIEELRQKVRIYEEQQQCDVCCDARTTNAFSCGHTLCGTCALKVQSKFQKCHICSKPITKIIPLYM